VKDYKAVCECDKGYKWDEYEKKCVYGKLKNLFVQYAQQVYNALHTVDQYIYIIINNMIYDCLFDIYDVIEIN